MKRPFISKKTRELVLRLNNYDCYYCNTSLVDRKWDIDHIIPKSRGGTDDTSNLVPSCMSCNRSKNYRTADEYLLQKQERRKKRIEQIENYLSIEAFDKRYAPMGVSFSEYLTWNI